MVDICFQDSEAGETKFRLWNMVRNDCLSEVEKLKEQHPEKIKEIDFFYSGDGKYCNSSDIYCLDMFLDIGYLNGDILEEQKKFRRDWFSDCTEDEFEKDWQRVNHYFLKILRAIQSDEPMRIWVSNSITTRCNFLFFCSLMKQYNYSAKALLISTDAKMKEIDGVWENIALREGNDVIIKRAEFLTKKMIEERAAEYQKLVDDKKPLRVLENNKIVSVDEDYFDAYILEHAPQNKFNIYRLIGDTLYFCGTHYYYIFQRIEKLIAEGKFTLVRRKNNKYGRHDLILKRNY